jgi:hypothetical protein
MWISKLHLSLVNDWHGFLMAKLLPYDGQYLLATGGKDVFIRDLQNVRKTDMTLDAVLTALDIEIQRQYGNEFKKHLPNLEGVTVPSPSLITLQVFADDPSKPVKANAFCDSGAIVTIEDCFALTATDQQFAQVFISTMGEIARQAQLSLDS